MGAQQAGAPVLTGTVPPLAPFYSARLETGFDLATALRPGETILLVPATPGAGGTGKTQLAVGFAHAMWSERAVGLLAWVPAGNRSTIIAGYAQAAADLRLVPADEPADSAAHRFLAWLRTTERRWAVVLDGVASPADTDGLWPQGPAGQVVLTSRLRESELAWSGANVTAHAVGRFSRREALGYFNTRLTGYPDQRIEALDLAEDLDGLPIALAQAAGVVTVSDTTCRDYRAAYTERLQATTEAVVEGCPRPLLATWSLAVEYAHRLSPVGLAWPALVMASVFNTSGIPAAVLTSPAACAYITGRPADGQDGADGTGLSGTGLSGTALSGTGSANTGPNLVRSAYAMLERLGLVSVDRASAVRTVWVHTTVRAAVRAYLAPGNVEQAVTAAAAALLEAWPEAGAEDYGPQLSQALRDSADALRTFAGDLLWKPEAHPLLLRTGTSLAEAPVLAESAIGYWRAFGATSIQLLGYGHPQSVLARDRLADAYAGSGRLAEALPVFEAAVSEREAAFGPQHPETMTARLNVARSLNSAGREPEAIAICEQVLVVRERTLGAGHPETLAVRAQLAAAYEAAGRGGDSIRLYERALVDAEREFGPAHRDTQATRVGLAEAYLGVGRAREAVSALQRALADAERTAGADDPVTVATRASLAGAYRAMGKNKDAINAYERVLADRERTLGAGHPDTIAARGSLAFAYRTAGRLKDAIPQYERLVADRERTLSPDHRDTLAARAILGATYQEARRMREAIDIYEQVVADSERALGPGNIDTLTTRCNLATAYYEAGRQTDGVKMLRRAFADCERYLGPDHPMTNAVKENLQSVAE
jgi:tetratricopeptide (TPR) repeat protein